MMIYYLLLIKLFSPEFNDSSQELSWRLLEKPTVLLELFTSQGCSSCPPADALLAKLQNEAKQGEVSLFALSFHVDYWNSLGWKDPYSQEQFSSRQRIYAKKFQSPQVYTPQVVVNGRSGHIGSREIELRMAIRQQKQSERAGFELKIGNQKNDKIGFKYQIGDNNTAYTFNMALVRPRVSNSVPKGENRGRTLKHKQVVMVFKSEDLTKSSGVIQFDHSDYAIQKEDQLVCFFQKTNNWVVEDIQVFEQIN